MLGLPLHFLILLTWINSFLLEKSQLVKNEYIPFEIIELIRLTGSMHTPK